MTLGAAETGAADDPERLRDALARINAARRAPAYGPARVGALLGGFERLVEALPGERPRAAGAESLAELEGLLGAQGAEEGAEALRRYLEPLLDRLLEGLLDYPERRLAAYGSLLPGEDNHHHIATLVGRWTRGTVEGRLLDRGWAERRGYPGFLARVPGDPVAVNVFESLALPGAWERLDAFEGAAYRRILIRVETEAGPVVSNIYEWLGATNGA